MKAEYEVLYPLEKSFFSLPKPPILTLHEEIAYVEFKRHVVGGLNMHYLDLLVKLETEQEYPFWNIRRMQHGLKLSLQINFQVSNKLEDKLVFHGGWIVRIQLGAALCPNNPYFAFSCI